MALRKMGASMPQAALSNPCWTVGALVHTPAGKYLSLAEGRFGILHTYPYNRIKTLTFVLPPAAVTYTSDQERWGFFAPTLFFSHCWWKPILDGRVMQNGEFHRYFFPTKNEVWQYFGKHVSAYDKARILISGLIFDYNSWWQLPCHSFLPLCARARKAAHSLYLS